MALCALRKPRKYKAWGDPESDMTRVAYLGSLALVALACGALPACGQQDQTQVLIAKCSDPAPADVDTCMEQVRVLNETDPSPEAGKLLAHLIQLQVEARDNPPPTPLGQPQDAPPDDHGVSSYDVSPPEPPVSPDLGPGPTYDAPPDVPPQEEAPPVEQGDPNDVGTDDSAPAPHEPREHGRTFDLTPPGGGAGK